MFNDKILQNNIMVYLVVISKIKKLIFQDLSFLTLSTFFCNFRINPHPLNTLQIIVIANQKFEKQ